MCGEYFLRGILGVDMFVKSIFRHSACKCCPATYHCFSGRWLMQPKWNFLIQGSFARVSNPSPGTGWQQGPHLPSRSRLRNCKTHS
uniref:Uncharacterized protein n=1 Tax=Arundo donax TaxID=35708 RepID=A0A0A9D2A7_ARUDO